MTSPAIQTTGLTKFYGAHRGIEEVDLTVDRGEVFGFLGPNGAGKTTTIRLLLDLIRPTRGKAEVLGLDCRRDSLLVRRSIGFLPSEFRLYENLSGRQLLGYLGGLGREVDWSYVGELSDRLSLELSRSIRTLSHGNKQKLAIALAFLHRSPVVVLDEPTTGLDPLLQQEFFDLVEEQRAAGSTVFLSSHNLTEVERVCDRVASVREGRLIAVEDVSSIRASAVRKVELTCARDLSVADFATIEGIGDLEVDGPALKCTMRGPLGPLVAAAGAYEIVDILSREPSLEEFFLAMYGNRRQRHAG